MPRTSHREPALLQAAVHRDPATIDHAVLDTLLCDDREAVGVVLRQFRSSCPGDASALGDALSRNQSTVALRWAHRLKGACQMIGAQRLADACERVEAAVRADDARRIAAAASDIEDEARRITEYLDEWLKTSP